MVRIISTSGLVAAARQYFQGTGDGIPWSHDNQTESETEGAHEYQSRQERIAVERLLQEVVQLGRPAKKCSKKGIL